jgi:glutaryl-CoA dehydrogenase
MSDYRGLDFYNVAELFTDEEQMVQEAVRSFTSQKIVPIISDHFRDETFPKELIPQVGELGLFGATIEGYGCAGMSNVGYGIAMQELERGDSGMRSFVSVQGALCMYPIYAFGNEEQREKWLPSMATGETLGCFGLTEPDYGSDPGGMITRCKKKGDGWILNGTKFWITSATISDIAIVWAKDEDDVVQGFVVETDRPGFTANKIHGKWSLRASDTGELVLEDVEVPEANRLPNTKGLVSALMCLSQARYGIAWGVLGAAQDCYDTALDYGKNRIIFDKPVAGFQLYQQKLANMATEITKGQLLVHRLGQLKDNGVIKHYHISMAKRNNCNIALDVARDARDMLGGNGILDEYPVIRHMVNLETVKTYEGTHDIHTLIIGQELTGISAVK